ncbi:MAG: porin family protein [Epsilonproteobacteria bacterium]|nr:porin family protein [Campylobacterota bacterium]
MKTLKLSVIALIAMGSLGYAGGDFTPVTPYETEDIIEAEAYVEPYVEEPVYVALEPAKPVVEAPIVPVVPPQPAKIVANGFYAGLGITGVRYENDCVCKTVDTKDTSYGAVARVGYDFNEYIGIEARGSKTNGDSDVEHAGLFVKPMVPVTDNTNVYGLVGVAKTKIKGDVPHVDSDGMALGAGIEVDLSADTPKNGRYSRDFDGRGDQEKGVGIFVDYERMLVKDNAPDIDAVSAGVTYDF